MPAVLSRRTLALLINNKAAVSEAAAGDLPVPPDPLYAAVPLQSALFTSSFLNVQLNRHIRIWSCTAGLICLSGPTFGFSLILSKSNCPSVSTVSPVFPPCSVSPTYSAAVSSATSQDGLSCFYWGVVGGFLSFAFCFPSPCVLQGPFLFCFFVDCMSQFLCLSLVLPLALISAQFPSRSLSLCCNLKYAPSLPLYCIFSSLFL